MPDPTLRLRTRYYEQFGADYKLDVPAEGYGGWKTSEVDINPERTAIVVMHAWDVGMYEQFPGLWSACDEIPRTYKVCREVFPKLLGTVRASGLPLFHVVGGGGYYKHLPGYHHAVNLAGAKAAPLPWAGRDETKQALNKFRNDHVFVGAANQKDAEAAGAIMNFPKEAMPLGDEGVAETAEQLTALALETGVNHLIYAGFNIDWCLLMSPCGMIDMQRRGFVCSAFEQAVTAVENKETARKELCKEIGLWRVSVNFGFVFDVDDFVKRAAPLIEAHRTPVKTAPDGKGRMVSARRDRTWIEADGKVYGAKADADGPIGGGMGYQRGFTTGDFTVNSVPQLLDALGKAKAGQTIFIDSNATLDVTDWVYRIDNFTLPIPAGVTLASDRGYNGSPGATIMSEALQTSPLLKPMGAGVRISGLRLRGPDPQRRLDFHHRVFYELKEGCDVAYYKLPNSDAITCDQDRLEVDNCDIGGWSHGGVYLVRGKGHRLHHNFIHHCQRMGLGYGVCMNHDSEAWIAFNQFQDNKHHIAGTGSPGQVYEACHNVVLLHTESHEFNGKPYGQDHLFDMHGGSDRGDGTDIAGKRIHIHHNTFRSTYPAVNVRGLPQEELIVEGNWFLHSAPRVQWSSVPPPKTAISSDNYSHLPDGPVVLTDGRAMVRGNAYGPAPSVRIELD